MSKYAGTKTEKRKKTVKIFLPPHARRLMKISSPIGPAPASNALRNISFSGPVYILMYRKAADRI